MNLQNINLSPLSDSLTSSDNKNVEPGKENAPGAKKSRFNWNLFYKLIDKKDSGIKEVFINTNDNTNKFIKIILE